MISPAIGPIRPMRPIPTTPDESEPIRTSAAERQARYRAKTDVLRAEVQALREAFEQAADAAGMSAVADRLPDEPTECLREIRRRLEGARMFVMPIPVAGASRPSRRSKPAKALLDRIRKDHKLDRDQALDVLAAALRSHRIREAILAHVQEHLL